MEVDQEADGERVERIVPFVFPKADLMAEIELKAGIPFDSARRSHDRSALQRYYGERDYLAAAFFVNPAEADGFRTLPAEVLLDPLRAEVHVTLKLVQGRPRTVRAVEIAGNTNTHDEVVRREISILPGETADLKEIERSLQRIRGLGYFLDRQDPDHKPPTYRFREVSGDPGVIDIEYEVEEGRVVDFQLQGGVASDSGLVASSALTSSPSMPLTLVLAKLVPSLEAKPEVKKYFISKTPWGVSMYLPETARLTVVSCTPTTSATCDMVIGRSCDAP